MKYSFLRIVRIILAAIMFVACLGIFLDFTGVLPAYLGWVAQIQLVPAILALNLGVLAILAILTLIFGRIYCSILCPLGIFQDLWSSLRGKKRKYLYREQTKKRRIIRYSVLGVFLVMVIAGCSIAAIFEPYSAFGRMASSLFAPVYDAVNNQLAVIAEHHNSYAFYGVDIWIRGMASFVLAIVTFVGLAICGILTGRSYCSNFCPVGTLLGLLGRFSLFKIKLDQEKCRKCGSCSNKCKMHCIDIQNHQVDPERCIACMNCLSTCQFDAISYVPSIKNMISGLPNVFKAKNNTFEKTSDQKDKTQIESSPKMSESKPPEDKSDSHSKQITNQPAETDNNKDDVSLQEKQQNTSNPINERRLFLAATAAAAGAAICPALAIAKSGEDALTRKEPSPRETLIVPPGAQSHVNFFRHCTGCMLCVRACHNQVLRTVSHGNKILHPTLSFEHSYCRPTCNDCSQVCPTGAIRKITLEQKSSIQIGQARVNLETCLSASKGFHCRACARSCPSGAITFVASQTPEGKKCKIPNIDTERCIGCGACEYTCAARPIAAIHVEGNFQHREI